MTCFIPSRGLWSALKTLTIGSGFEKSHRGFAAQNRRGFTVISDKQEGLLKAMDYVFLQAEHRVCAKYIYSNWIKNHEESRLKPLFWQVATSFHKPSYERNMEVIWQVNLSAHASLLATNSPRCCRALFKTTSQCGDVYNFSESFNNATEEARVKPILDMLEDIRWQTMVRLAKRSATAHSWNVKFALKADQKLEKACMDAQRCMMYVSTRGLYETVEDGCGHRVDLPARSCSCRKWDLTGLPCCHAICAIIRDRHDLDIFVSDHYLMTKLQATYQHSIMPMNGEMLWQKLDKKPIVAPTVQRNAVPEFDPPLPNPNAPKRG